MMRYIGNDCEFRLVSRLSSSKIFDSPPTLTDLKGKDVFRVLLINPHRLRIAVDRISCSRAIHCYLVFTDHSPGFKTRKHNVC